MKSSNIDKILCFKIDFRNSWRYIISIISKQKSFNSKIATGSTPLGTQGPPESRVVLSVGARAAARSIEPGRAEPCRAAARQGEALRPRGQGQHRSRSPCILARAWPLGRGTFISPVAMNEDVIRGRWIVLCGVGVVEKMACLIRVFCH